VEVPELGAVVVRDTFPACVTVGELVHDTARAVVTRTHVYVWTADTGSPTLVEAAAYNPEESSVPPLNASRNKRTALRLADGRELHIVRASGCGCGNPLRHWQPWAPYRKGTM
jgi:hypothetical protein